MEYGISLLSMIPVRKSPSHRSEMVTQLLFGDTYSVFTRQDEWFEIQTTFDNYAGWISNNQYTALSAEELILFTKDFSVVSGLNGIITIKSTGASFPVFPGSVTPSMKESGFNINGLECCFEGENTAFIENSNARDIILEKSALYLHSPYLWGGKTPSGTDCSGFVQMLYRIAGITLPRDAALQAETGETVNFLSDALPGDLIFFDNEEGIITHTGVLLEEGKIIHASGKVRIDDVDHQGIFDRITGKYTHKLRTIKKII